MIYINGVPSGYGTFIGGVPFGGKDVVRQTTSETHVYADGTSGDDSNDGLSASSPKKTLQAVFDILPDIIGHNSSIHLSGTFADYGSVYLQKILKNNVRLIIDGGDSVTDIGLGTLTADISSTTSIGDSSKAWTIDQYGGYLVKVLTGPAAGQIRTIFSNTATTITPSRNFSVDPGAGATFQIVKPATTLSASTFSIFYIVGCAGSGTVHVQRLTTTGTNARLRVQFNDVSVSYGSMILECTSAAAVQVQLTNAFDLGYFEVYDPDTFTDFGTSGNSSGVGQINGGMLIETVNGRLVGAMSYVKNVTVRKASITLFYRGFHSNGTFNVYSSAQATSSPGIQGPFSGYQNVTFSNSSGPGILFVSCPYIKLSRTIIANCNTYGIEIANSHIELDRVSGTSNTDAGVYARDLALVTYPSGKAPTVTGGSGDLKLYGGYYTWSSLVATPQTDSVELVRAKVI